MKTLTIALIMCCTAAQAQTFAKPHMYVVMIQKDTSFCRYQQVLYGGDKETLCLHVEGNYYHCFKKTGQCGDHYIADDNFTGQQYALKFVETDKGFFFTFQNISGGYPHYFMSTSNICQSVPIVIKKI